MHIPKNTLKNNKLKSLCTDKEYSTISPGGQFY